jgi:hypothetical protein
MILSIEVKQVAFLLHLVLVVGRDDQFRDVGTVRVFKKGFAILRAKTLLNFILRGCSLGFMLDR